MPGTFSTFFILKNLRSVAALPPGGRPDAIFVRKSGGHFTPSLSGERIGVGFGKWVFSAKSLIGIR